MSAGIENCLWDVIIVGTGMGGATAGHALARQGLKVLFVDKGRSPAAPAGFIAVVVAATARLLPRRSKRSSA